MTDKKPGKKIEAEKKTSQIFLRIDPITLGKLNLLKSELRLTQSELIRKLIEYAYDGFMKSEKSKENKNDGTDPIS